MITPEKLELTNEDSCNIELIEVYKENNIQLKKNKDLEEPLKQVENQQNNIFLGSTADLQKLLKKKV